MSAFFLYNENHAIVAWFKRGLTDEQKVNKRDKKYFEKGSFEKVPLVGMPCAELSALLTEGLSVKIQIY